MELAQRIVVGLDLDPHHSAPTAGSMAAAQTARWLAAATGAHVTLVHAVARDEYFDPLSSELVPVSETIAAVAHHAVGELTAQFRAAGIGCETVECGDRPSVCIAHEVQRQQADLVLLGKHDGHEVDSTHIGPIATRVLRECPARIWMVVPDRALQPRKIVAATDLTDAGDEVTRCAAAIADLARAELHVIHVHPPLLHARAAREESRVRRLEELMAKPLSEAQRSGARLHVREAAPAQGVLSLVEDLEADLTCLAIRSHQRAPASLVGSTAERLLARLDTSLFVLKPV